LVLEGNGPGGTSLKYLDYWSPQCIGGSGHGGRGGNPALPNFQVGGYSGLEYGQRNTQVLVGGSSGIDSLFIVHFFAAAAACL